MTLVGTGAVKWERFTPCISISADAHGRSNTSTKGVSLSSVFDCLSFWSLVMLPPLPLGAP